MPFENEAVAEESRCADFQIVELSPQSCEKRVSYQRFSLKMWEIYESYPFLNRAINCTFACQIQAGMSTSRLQDDLLQGFYEEQKLIREQLEIFDPLAVSLRQPVAQRLLSKGALIFFEVVCYLFALAVVALIIFIDRIFPFHLLHVLRSRELFSNNLGRADIDSLYFAVAGLLVLIALLSFILARVLRRVRLKNDILNLAGKHIKTLVGQHLKRMAVLDSIEQRHFTELPPMQANPTSIPPQITPDEDPNWRMDI